MPYHRLIDTSVCHRCGTVADGPQDAIPLGWSSMSVDDGIAVLCDRCTRHHVRDIESKLDETWWS